MNAAAVSSLRSGDVVNVTEMRSGWMKIGAEQWTLSKLDNAIYLKPGTFLFYSTIIIFSFFAKNKFLTFSPILPSLLLSLHLSLDSLLTTILTTILTTTTLTSTQKPILFLRWF